MPKPATRRPEAGISIVVGAGIVGAHIALELVRRGERVVLLDAGEPGHGCSFGNAGWLTPCFAMPLPAPGVFRQALRWCLDGASPLRVPPGLAFTQAPWLLRFALAATPARFEAGTRALTELSLLSLRRYEAFAQELAQQGDVGFGFTRAGLLMACESREGLEAAHEELRLAALQGVRGEALGAAAVRARESALIGPLEGGVYFPDEAHVQPLAAVQAAVREFTRLGGTLRTRETLTGFDTHAGAITHARTDQGRLAARHVVLATGTWTRVLGRSLGVRAPILGGKGYSMMAPRLQPQPRSPIMLLERKVAVTPYKDAVRIAGTLELVAHDDGVSPRRVQSIVAAARRALPLPETTPLTPAWHGLRPCTPDGMPIIGRAHGYANLTLAAGHQMLGLQSAPGTAMLAADLVLGSTPAVDPVPFRADRF
jgi:D-amino-acid dehydrogenase